MSRSESAFALMILCIILSHVLGNGWLSMIWAFIGACYSIIYIFRSWKEFKE